MSIKALTWAFAQKHLTANEKWVLVSLADFYNDNEERAWPKQETLAEHTRLNVRTVKRCVAELERKGFITIKARREKGLQKSNFYKLNMLVIAIQVPGDTQSPDGVTQSHPAGGHTVPLIEPEDEPLIEPLNGASAEEDMKTFGSGDVEEALKASVSDKEADPYQHIKTLQKTGTRYTVDTLRSAWATLYVHHGYGFLPEWTMKEKGQINQFQKKLGDLPVLKVMGLVVDQWNEFRNATDAYKPPTKPNVGFLLKHVGAAGEMYLQTLAKPELKQAEPTFVVPQDLTNESESSDNESEKTPLDWLENLET